MSRVTFPKIVSETMQKEFDISKKDVVNEIEFAMAKRDCNTNKDIITLAYYDVEDSAEQVVVKVTENRWFIEFEDQLFEGDIEIPFSFNPEVETKIVINKAQTIILD